MRNRMSGVCDRLVDFITGIAGWLWDTFELVFDILLELLARAIELVIAILHLSFQVICFLRDLCIEAMQTFTNVFRGVVNVVSSIKCEDVEDFAAACMVLLLWVGAVKLAFSVLEKRKKPLPNPLKVLKATNDRAPIARDKTPIPVKAPMKKRVTNQARRGIATKRTVESSISSSSSASNDLGD